MSETKQIIFDNKEQMDNVINHYAIMIDWAEQQPEDKCPNYSSMKEATGQAYSTKYCVLCGKYFTQNFMTVPVCDGCPLDNIGMNCNKHYSWFNKMSDAITYKGFLIEAKKFLNLCKAGTWKGDK